MTNVFGPNLASKVHSIAILTYESHDVRVWRSFCGQQRVRAKDLYAIYCKIPTRKLDTT